MRLLSRLAWLSVISLICAACGDGSVDGLSFPVDEPGPYNVGFRKMQLTYASPGVDGERTIEVFVWYPTEDEPGPETESPLYVGFFDPPAPTIVDAEPAPSAYEGGYPVLVHSHGASGTPDNSYFLMTAFARQGWVVVAPEHVGDTIDTAFEPTPLHTRYERMLDVSAALDMLETLPADDPLAGRAVTERVVASGHSRGTYTVWAMSGISLDTTYVQQSCDAGDWDDAGGCTPEQIAAFGDDYRDARIVAGIPMAGDGDWRFFGGIAPMNDAEIPMLMLTGGDDIVGAQEVFDAATAVELVWVEIAGGCHQLFGFGNCDMIDDEVGTPIVDTYALAFARFHLLGDMTPMVSGILAGSVEVSSLATVMTR